MGRLDALIRARNKWESDEIKRKQSQSESDKKHKELDR